MEFCDDSNQRVLRESDTDNKSLSCTWITSKRTSSRPRMTVFPIVLLLLLISGIASCTESDETGDNPSPVRRERNYAIGLGSTRSEVIASPQQKPAKPRPPKFGDIIKTDKGPKNTVVNHATVKSTNAANQNAATEKPPTTTTTSASTTTTPMRIKSVSRTLSRSQVVVQETRSSSSSVSANQPEWTGDSSNHAFHQFLHQQVAPRGSKRQKVAAAVAGEAHRQVVLSQVNSGSQGLPMPANTSAQVTADRNMQSDAPLKNQSITVSSTTSQPTTLSSHIANVSKVTESLVWLPSSTTVAITTSTPHLEQQPTAKPSTMNPIIVSHVPTTTSTETVHVQAHHPTAKSPTRTTTSKAKQSVQVAQQFQFTRLPSPTHVATVVPPTTKKSVMSKAALTAALRVLVNGHSPIPTTISTTRHTTSTEGTTFSDISSTTPRITTYSPFPAFASPTSTPNSVLASTVVLASHLKSEPIQQSPKAWIGDSSKHAFHQFHFETSKRKSTSPRPIATKAVVLQEVNFGARVTAAPKSTKPAPIKWTAPTISTTPFTTTKPILPKPSKLDFTIHMTSDGPQLIQISPTSSTTQTPLPVVSLAASFKSTEHPITTPRLTPTFIISEPTTPKQPVPQSTQPSAPPAPVPTAAPPTEKPNNQEGWSTNDSSKHSFHQFHHEKPNRNPIINWSAFLTVTAPKKIMDVLSSIRRVPTTTTERPDAAFIAKYVVSPPQPTTHPTIMPHQLPQLAATTPNSVNFFQTQPTLHQPAQSIPSTTPVQVTEHLTGPPSTVTVSSKPEGWTGDSSNHAFHQFHHEKPSRPHGQIKTTSSILSQHQGASTTLQSSSPLVVTGRPTLAPFPSSAPLRPLYAFTTSTAFPAAHMATTPATILRQPVPPPQRTFVMPRPSDIAAPPVPAPMPIFILSTARPHLASPTTPQNVAATNPTTETKQLQVSGQWSGDSLNHAFHQFHFQQLNRFPLSNTAATTNIATTATSILPASMTATSDTSPTLQSTTHRPPQPLQIMAAFRPVQPNHQNPVFVTIPVFGGGSQMGAVDLHAQRLPAPQTMTQMQSPFFPIRQQQQSEMEHRPSPSSPPFFQPPPPFREQQNIQQTLSESQWRGQDAASHAFHQFHFQPVQRWPLGPGPAPHNRHPVTTEPATAESTEANALAQYDTNGDDEGSNQEETNEFQKERPNIVDKPRENRPNFREEFSTNMRPIPLMNPHVLFSVMGPFRAQDGGNREQFRDRPERLNKEADNSPTGGAQRETEFSPPIRISNDLSGEFSVDNRGPPPEWQGDSSFQAFHQFHRQMDKQFDKADAKADSIISQSERPL